MRPIAILLWACSCAPQLRAHQLLDVQCDVTTRTIGQITKLAYSFATSNTSTAEIGPNTQQSMSNGYHSGHVWSSGAGTQVPPNSNPASSWTQVPNSAPSSSSSSSSNTTPRSGTNSMNSPVMSGSIPSSAPGTGSMPQSSGQTTPAQTLTLPASMSSSSGTAQTTSAAAPICVAAAPPPGFQAFCGQVPGPNSVILTTLRKRAFASFDVCTNACLANQLCAGVSYREIDGLCTLYRSIVDFVVDPTFDTYTKAPVSSPSNSMTVTQGQPTGSSGQSTAAMQSISASEPTSLASTSSIPQPGSQVMLTSSVSTLAAGTLMSSQSESVATPTSKASTSSTTHLPSSAIKITITRASSTSSSMGPTVTEVDLPDDQDTDLDIGDLYDAPDDMATDVSTDPPVSFVSLNPNGKGLLVNAPPNYSGVISAVVTVTNSSGTVAVAHGALKDRAVDPLLSYLVTIILNIIPTPKVPVTTTTTTTTTKTTTRTTTTSSTTRVQTTTTTSQLRTSQTTTLSTPTSVLKSQTSSSVNAVKSSLVSSSSSSGPLAATTTKSLGIQTSSSVTSLLGTNPGTVTTSILPQTPVTSIGVQTSSSVTSLIGTSTDPGTVPTSQATLLQPSGASSSSSSIDTTTSLLVAVNPPTTTTTTTPAPSPTPLTCSFKGYDNGTNIGFYGDAASATYSGCNSICNANPSCQSFVVSSNSPPACIIYSYSDVSSFAIYSPTSNNTFYLRGGGCAPVPVTPTTTTTTTSASPTPSPNFPVCRNGKIPFSVSSNTLASTFTDCGTMVTIDGLGTYENPNSVCQLDVSGQAYCNNCNSCANATACTADSDCPSNYACILNSACTISGNVGVAMCLYMLYDSNAGDFGCYPPY